MGINTLEVCFVDRVETNISFSCGIHLSITMSVSWALSLLSLVAVFHSLQCQSCRSNQDCSVSYTRAPAALSNSPLNCSMEGRQVTITCEMATLEVLALFGITPPTEIKLG